MSPFFFILYAISIIAFLAGCYRSLSVVRFGKQENRFDKIGTRLGNMLSFGIGQKRVIEETYGINHLIIFWSFIIFVVADAQAVIYGIFPACASICGVSRFAPIVLLFDVAPFVTLVGMAVALARRFFLPPENIKDRSNDVLLMFGIIVLLILSFYGERASMIAAGRVASSPFMPVSNIAATIISALPAEVLGNLFLSIPAFVILFFAAYVPKSRHMHMMTAIPNSFFRRLEAPAIVPREEFAKGKRFGVGEVTDFSWKDIFDTYSCTECERCENICPATATGKPLNPRHIIRAIQENLFSNLSNIRAGEKLRKPLIGEEGIGSISEEALWACTTCAGCVDQCPVSIEHLPKIIKMRRHLVEAEAKFPSEVITLFENTEQRSNPWGMAPSEKAKWYANLDVKHFEAGKTEYLFFVGCAGALDSRARQVTVSFAKILNAAGVSWGVLGSSEKCCGDSIRRLGNEYIFEQIVNDNMKMFAEKGIKKIVTHCPHCFNTLKNDYKQFGAELEVIHHSEFIQKLFRDGKIKPNVKDMGKLVFHDPCYLGRHNDIYDAPRDIIEKATGKAPSEMERHHRKSFCCGAGGGRMWMEETVGTRINRTRVREALNENPDVISVSCPYCLIMFEDGLKDEKVFEKVKVKDIAEIVSEGLQR